MIKKEEFGGSGITWELFEWITENIPLGRPFLELGAGLASTKFLSERYKLYSVEDKHQYINKFKSKYILAPIYQGANWYDIESLKDELPEEYDCILVDGPTGEGNRNGFLENINLFRNDVPIIIDDTWREAEKNLLLETAKKLNRQYILFENFGVILKDSNEIGA